MSDSVRATYRGRRPSVREQGYSPTKVFSVDVSEGLKPEWLLGEYRQALILIKCQGRPMGLIRLSVDNHVVTAEQIRQSIADDWVLGQRLGQMALRKWLMRQDNPKQGARPSWSVIVCTRNRADQLKRCLESIIAAAKTGGGEIVVVDNDPPDEATRQLVENYPVRYVREMRRGLNWARTAGAEAASGDILIYTDDDVVVDERWIAAMLEPFGSPRVAAVTGLTLPYELETPPQDLFEFYGGHGRGFIRRVYDYTGIAPAAAGLVGSGANMAMRRELVLSMRLFDNEFDVGTATLSGGDAYAFYQFLIKGYQIVYTPDALVWHQHRRDYASLERMLYGYSVGGFAFLTRCLIKHKDWQALYVALEWLRSQHIKQLGRWLTRKPDALPIGLIMTEWKGFFVGPWAYFKALGPERVRHASQKTARIANHNPHESAAL